MRLISAVVAPFLMVLVGCSTPMGSGSVPVDDRSTSSAVTNSKPDTPGSTGQSAVAAVNLGGTPADVAMALVGRTVYFEYDSFAIRPEFQATLESSANVMRTQKARRLAIEGHTDERGGREYNLALGQKRADAVRRALALLGVEESQMEAVSFGKEKPAMAGSSETAMEKNRRAEVNIR